MKIFSTLLAAAAFLPSVSGDSVNAPRRKSAVELAAGATPDDETKRELSSYGRGGKKGSSGRKGGGYKREKFYGGKKGSGGRKGGYYNREEYCQCPSPKTTSCKATIAVANRGSGTLSVLDADTGHLLKTVRMPRANSVPMYVMSNKGRVFVGDRGNNEIVVFDATQHYKVIKIMPGGNGIFHMFADQAGTILWVNNDIDNTITVYDIVNLQPIKTIPIDPDIVALKKKPHDLIISFDGKYAFVTFVAVDQSSKDGKDILVKYDTSTYLEVARRSDLAEDPHVGLTFRNNKLYVAQQGGNVVSILDSDTLSNVADNLDIPDAHGVLMFSSNDKVAYFTDISDADGKVGIYAVDLDSNDIIGSLTTGIPPTPHNIVGTGEKLFVTHSGATNNLVTIYEASIEYPTPRLIKTVKVGLNPFGADFVESTCDIYDQQGFY